MKPTIYLAALFASVALFTPLKADESAKSPMMILTVDPVTLEKSSAFQDIVKQLEAERGKIQKNLVTYETDLKKKDEKLAAAQKKLLADEQKLKVEDEKLAVAQKKLSAEAFAKERQKFEALVAAQKKLSEDFTKERQKFEALVNTVRQKLEREKIRMELAFDEGRKKVSATFLTVVQKIREEKKAVVLFANAIAAAPANADISADVLKEMDKSLKSVPVVFKSDKEIQQLVDQQAGSQQPSK